MKQISKETIEKEYRLQKDKYKSLGINLKQSLKSLIENESIKHLDVFYRIKDIDSLLDKFESKGYKNLEEVSDICGVRIICYYISDIKKICRIIEREFQVLEKIDKSEETGIDQFGYRSTHLIVRFKDAWTKYPIFKNLKNLKAEIQVRTVLAHAWAEMEHELAYKNISQAPLEIKRKLAILAANLEEADVKFEDVRKERESANKKLIGSGKKILDSNNLNLDSLQAFMDLYLAGRKKDIKSTANFLEELGDLGIDFQLILDGYKKFSKYISAFEKTLSGKDLIKGSNSFTQVGIVRMILMNTNDTYYKEKAKLFTGEIINVIDSFRGKIKEKNS